MNTRSVTVASLPTSRPGAFIEIRVFFTRRIGYRISATLRVQGKSSARAVKFLKPADRFSASELKALSVNTAANHGGIVDSVLAKGCLALGEVIPAALPSVVSARSAPFIGHREPEFLPRFRPRYQPEERRSSSTYLSRMSYFNKFELANDALRSGDAGPLTRLVAAAYRLNGKSVFFDGRPHPAMEGLSRSAAYGAIDGDMGLLSALLAGGMSPSIEDPNMGLVFRLLLNSDRFEAGSKQEMVSRFKKRGCDPERLEWQGKPLTSGVTDAALAFAMIGEGAALESFRHMVTLADKLFFALNLGDKAFARLVGYWSAGEICRKHGNEGSTLLHKLAELCPPSGDVKTVAVLDAIGRVLSNGATDGVLNAKGKSPSTLTTNSDASALLLAAMAPLSPIRISRT